MRLPAVRLRRCWLTLHRWVGLSFGLVLLAAAVTGSLLVVASPLDRALHPELFAAGSRADATLQPVVSRLRDEFGSAAAFNIRLPARRGDTLQVLVSGRWQGTVYLDPSSGQELGRRAAGEGFFNALFELHSTLFAGDTGRAVLAAAALAYALMLLSGVVLWWPKNRSWRHAFSVRRRPNAAVLLFDVHRVAGVCLGVLVLASVGTGVYMAWKPLAGWVTYLHGRSPAATPAPAALAAGIERPDQVDEAIRNASSHWPGAIVSAVHVPPGSWSATRVRVRLPDDPHPIGMSTLWTGSDGTVRAGRRWSELELGNRLYSVMYPLHQGSLFGAGNLVLTLVAGLALTGMAASGLWLWARRLVRQG